MSKDFYIQIRDEKIPVTEDVYYAYKRPAWRETKRRRVRNDNEYSLAALEEDGFEAVSGEALIDDIVADNLLLEQLFAALAELTGDERGLIDALFFEEKSEREVARELGVSQPAIHKRRNRILEKLKKLLS